MRNQNEDPRPPAGCAKNSSTFDYRAMLYNGCVICRVGERPREGEAQPAERSPERPPERPPRGPEREMPRKGPREASREASSIPTSVKA